MPVGCRLKGCSIQQAAQCGIPGSFSRTGSCKRPPMNQQIRHTAFATQPAERLTNYMPGTHPLLQSACCLENQLHEQTDTTLHHHHHYHPAAVRQHHHPRCGCRTKIKSQQRYTTCVHVQQMSPPWQHRPARLELLPAGLPTAIFCITAGPLVCPPSTHYKPLQPASGCCVAKTFFMMYVQHTCPTACTGWLSICPIPNLLAIWQQLSANLCLHSCLCCLLLRRAHKLPWHRRCCLRLLRNHKAALIAAAATDSCWPTGCAGTVAAAQPVGGCPVRCCRDNC
jgi:hypothetical protein